MAMEMVKKDMEKNGYLGKDKMKDNREASAKKKEVNVASMLKTSKGRGKGVV